MLSPTTHLKSIQLMLYVRDIQEGDQAWQGRMRSSLEVVSSAPSLHVGAIGKLEIDDGMFLRLMQCVGDADRKAPRTVVANCQRPKTTL